MTVPVYVRGEFDHACLEKIVQLPNQWSNSLGSFSAISFASFGKGECRIRGLDEQEAGEGADHQS